MSKELMEEINKKTTISLNLLLAILIPAIVTAVAWGALLMRVQNIEDDVDEIKTQITALDDKFEDILRERSLSLSQ